LFRKIGKAALRFAGKSTQRVMESVLAELQSLTPVVRLALGIPFAATDNDDDGGMNALWRGGGGGGVQHPLASAGSTTVEAPTSDIEPFLAAAEMTGGDDDEATDEEGEDATDEEEGDEEGESDKKDEGNGDEDGDEEMDDADYDDGDDEAADGSDEGSEIEMVMGAM
jgi:hypothetical protein